MKKILFAFLFFANIALSQTVGTISYEQQAAEGYTLFSPLAFDTTYLIDNCGNVVNRWPCSYQNAMYAELTSNGTLMKAAVDPDMTYFFGGGAAGILLEYDWSGNVIWEYKISDSLRKLHHDALVMPNDNLLVVAWERMTEQECIAAGRDPQKIPNGQLWTTGIYEIQPVYPDSAVVVWEWHAWDHLVQDFSSSKNNYGNVMSNPQRIDFNKGNPNNVSDWAHVNSIDYNEELDQILIGSPMFNELWIIDHSTSTSQAADSVGGIYGKGGDLLWRWGNPASYNSGSASEQKLFFQHDGQWVRNGTRFENHISVFSNRDTINGNLGSKVKFIDPDFDVPNLEYPVVGGQFLPQLTTYEYWLVDTLFSPRLSGVEVLPNENLLICSGVNGHIIEIDTNENLVWEYVVPINAGGVILSQGAVSPQHKSIFVSPKYDPSYSGFTGINLVTQAPIELNPLTCSLVEIDNQTMESFELYPNPAQSSFKIRVGENVSFQVLDHLGKSLVEGKGSKEIDCSTWSRGMYFVRCADRVFKLEVIN